MFQDRENSQVCWRQLRDKVIRKIPLKIVGKHIKISFKGKVGVWGRRHLEGIEK